MSEKAGGGYLAGWIPTAEMKPKDGDIVICHHSWWKDNYGEPMIYRAEQKKFELQNFKGNVDEEKIDFWLKLPPIPRW